MNKKIQEKISFPEDVMREFFKKYFSSSYISNCTTSLQYIISSLQKEQSPNVWISVKSFLQEIQKEPKRSQNST